MFGAQLPAHIEGVAELVQVRGEVVLFQVNLANGRAHGPYRQPGVLQAAAHLTGLVQGDVGDVLPVHSADLQPMEPVALHGCDLPGNGRAGLVSKGKHA